MNLITLLLLSGLPEFDCVDGRLIPAQGFRVPSEECANHTGPEHGACIKAAVARWNARIQPTSQNYTLDELRERTQHRLDMEKRVEAARRECEFWHQSRLEASAREEVGRREEARKLEAGKREVLAQKERQQYRQRDGAEIDIRQSPASSENSNGASRAFEGWLNERLSAIQDDPAECAHWNSGRNGSGAYFNRYIATCSNIAVCRLKIRAGNAYCRGQ